jgi:hypothetical protein
MKRVVESLLGGGLALCLLASPARSEISLRLGPSFPVKDVIPIVNESLTQFKVGLGFYGGQESPDTSGWMTGTQVEMAFGDDTLRGWLTAVFGYDLAELPFPLIFTPYVGFGIHYIHTSGDVFLPSGDTHVDADAVGFSVKTGLRIKYFLGKHVVFYCEPFVMNFDPWRYAWVTNAGSQFGGSDATLSITYDLMFGVGALF